jgi:hypothetical protein
MKLKLSLTIIALIGMTQASQLHAFEVTEENSTFITVTYCDAVDLKHVFFDRFVVLANVKSGIANVVLRAGNSDQDSRAESVLMSLLLPQKWNKENNSLDILYKEKWHSFKLNSPISLVVDGNDYTCKPIQTETK